MVKRWIWARGGWKAITLPLRLRTWVEVHSSRDAFSRQGLFSLTLRLFLQGDKGIKGERGERGDRGLRGDPVNIAKASSWFFTHFLPVLGVIGEHALRLIKCCLTVAGPVTEQGLGDDMWVTHASWYQPVNHCFIILKFPFLLFFNIIISQLKSCVCLKTPIILHLIRSKKEKRNVGSEL